jgi:hypothetical protein
MEDTYKIGKAVPWYARKWWMGTRNVVSVETQQGWTAAAEFYVPWWAWLFELSHRLTFGYPKLAPIEEQA